MNYLSNVLASLPSFSQLLPATALVAILIFFVKEWPCPISPDTSDGMMMPGEKDDDTQQKNIH